MFEHNQYQSQYHEDPARPREPYETVSGVEETSVLFWGEHCIECAAPACFQTCDLYQPRPDLRCRRFAYGAYENTNFPTPRGFGTEVTFKQWAKLESRGNAALVPLRKSLFIERSIHALLPLVDVVGRLGHKVSRDARWSALSNALLERLSRRVHRKWGARKAPDAFLLELYNPSEEPLKLRLGMAPGKGHPDTGTQPFYASIFVPPGYSKHEFESIRFRHLVETGLPFDISMSLEGDSNGRLVFLTADFVRYASQHAGARAQAVKCVVWDLDNTLWDGVLLENEDVQLKPGMKELFQELDHRGVLASIASKNDFDIAWRKLESLGLADYFLFPQIGWQPKSQSIRTIAERLNIGVDSLAFVDDNPFELDEVRRALPDVVVVDAQEWGSLRSDPRFRGSASSDSKSRRRYYQDALKRTEAQHTHDGGYRDFIADSDLVVEIAPCRSSDHERVAELVQRTNQLNFSGKKYTRDALDELLSDPRDAHYVLRCKDKYGSYGTVGFSIVQRHEEHIVVKDFMLSCRVQGRFIERAFFHFLASSRPGKSARTLSVHFVATDRNAPARQALAELDFERHPDRNLMVLDLRKHSLECDFLEIVAS